MRIERNECLFHSEIRCIDHLRPVRVERPNVVEPAGQPDRGIQYATLVLSNQRPRGYLWLSRHTNEGSAGSQIAISPIAHFEAVRL